MLMIQETGMGMSNGICLHTMYERVHYRGTGGDPHVV